MKAEKGSCDYCGIELPMSELKEWRGDFVCPSCKRKIEKQQEEESEPGICPDCNGSGEGSHEGGICWSCKGKGER